MGEGPTRPALEGLIDRLHVGLVVLNPDFEVVLWNGFMETHSGRSSAEVVGVNLFEAFPDLPRKWLQQKIRSVFLLKHESFSSWEHRPYIFPFPHNRPITGGVDHMRQDCAFVPIPDESGAVAFVGLTLFDMTDASIYQEALEETKGRLEELSTLDGLTGIYNRAHLDDRIAREVARAQRYGGTLSVILMDIDHFKPVNDTYGHGAGDRVLIEVAEALRGCLREADILGRYGGEEFVVLSPETGLEGGRTEAERLRLAVAERTFRDVGMVTISLGVAEIREGEGRDQLLNRADEALYAAKEAGRNQVAWL